MSLYLGNQKVTPTIYYKDNKKLTQLVDGSVSELTAEDLKGITSIREYAFNSCSGLTSVTIPDSVTSIGASAFGNCSGLTSVTYLGTIDQWVEISFSDSSSNPLHNAHNLYINDELVTEVNLTTATKISAYAFIGYSGLTSATIGNSVTSIDNGVFDGCKGLTSVTIGNGVTSIGDYVFSWCIGLTSVTIPDSVTSIGNYAFSWCSSLTSVTIGNNVTSIGNGAFINCKGLTSVIIPNSVTRVGNYAFEYCSGLTSVTMLSTTPPTIGSSIFPSSFSGTITVPAGTGDTYKAATNWSKYADKIQEAAA